VTDAVSTRRQLNELRRMLQRQGASTRQIAAAIAQRFEMNPRVTFRHAVGLTQSEVADRYNQRWPSHHPKTFKQISYWECWQGPGSETSSASAREPSYEDLGRLAELYECLIDDLLFGPRRHPSTPPTAPGELRADLLPRLGTGGYAEKPEDDTVIAFDVPTGEGTITVTLSRRQFTELLAAGGLAALLPDTALASSEPATEPATQGAAYYRHVLTTHQSGHHLLTPAAHIAALKRELVGIDRARDDATGPVRHELRQMQSEYAEHISWLYRETGDLAACRQWADRAAGWALEAGDTAMATYMMLRNANLALDQGHHVQAIELATAVQNVSWTVPPVLQGVAKAYQARGHALTGTVAGAQLDAAVELIAHGRSNTDPAYLRFFTTDFADVQRATCYMDAGTPDRAITILQSKITALPISHRRDRAAYLARLGAAHAAGQVPDAAAFAGMGSLAEANRAASQHVLAELRHLDVTLMRHWPKQPKVRQFHDALLATRAG
jgi:hypothetical protein